MLKGKKFDAFALKHERRFFNKRQNKFISNRKQMRSAKITTHGYRGCRIVTKDNVSI